MTPDEDTALVLIDEIVTEEPAEFEFWSGIEEKLACVSHCEGTQFSF